MTTEARASASPTDLRQPGIPREWRLSIGNSAQEITALRFRATSLGAIRRFNAMVRSKPDMDVDLHFVVDPDSGQVASKAFRSAEGRRA